MNDKKTSELSFKLEYDATSLRHIPFDQYTKDFNLYINNNLYQISRFEADLLSPKICNLHSIDASTDEFSIFTENKGDFSKTLSLLHFKETELSLEEIIFQKEIFEKLENDFFMRYFSRYANNVDGSTAEEAEITVDNIIEILHKKEILINNKYLSKNVGIVSLENEIGFAAEKFHLIRIEGIKSLSIELLQAIMQNNKLKLENEDYLFDIVLDLYLKDKSASVLFECIEYSNLSNAKMQEFALSFDLNDINDNIWKSIIQSAFILQNKKNADSNTNKCDIRYLMGKYSFNRSFVYQEGSEFNGIFNFLTKRFGGNIHDLDVINITASSHFYVYEASRVVDFDTDDFFESEREPNSWICFDFKNRIVEIEAYSIKSCYDSLKDWVVEVSDDGECWTEIDRKENNTNFNEKEVATFSVLTKTPCRLVRIKQIGLNWDNSDFLNLTSVEFFGKMGKTKK